MPDYTGTILTRWFHKGREYLAVRDEQGFITIAYEESGYRFTAGNPGYDFCFTLVELPVLAARLNCPLPN